MKGNRDDKKGISFIILLIIVLISLIVVTSLGALGPLLREELRPIAVKYLNNTYNPHTELWAASPEAVTAIVWDYRGLDTFFETSVLFGGVIGVLMLFREITRGSDPYLRGLGLSFIAKRSTSIITIFILIIGIATILHGQLTPGGGFQGGAIAAVAPVLLLVVFSKKVLEGLKYRDVIALRSLGLIGISITASAIGILAVMCGGQGYIFQNQAKPSSQLSMPSQILDVPMGGTLWFLNIFEGFAVIFAFIIAFIIFLSSDNILSESIKGEDHAY